MNKAADGSTLLTIEIHGNQKIYEQLRADEVSEWSWTLYPPNFYLREYPIPGNIKSKEIAIKLKSADAARFDVALYLMEHNEVSEVSLKVAERHLEVSGQVDLMGERKPFRIKWKK